LRLDDIGASVLITCATLARDAVEAADVAADPPVVINVDGSFEGMKPAPTMLGQAQSAIEAVAAATSNHSLASLSDAALVGVLWRVVPPTPVEASHPLFILYTSGSTGKPKGIVHAHGGFQVGLCATSSIVLGLRPGAPAHLPEAKRHDVLLVVASPGWITGQAYMISAALLTRTPSILLDGSPVSPPDRFAAIIARHRVSVLKAGSTFLRMLMTHNDAQQILARHDLRSLRLGSFCAEPVQCPPPLPWPPSQSPSLLKAPSLTRLLPVRGRSTRWCTSLRCAT